MSKCFDFRFLQHAGNREMTKSENCRRDSVYLWLFRLTYDAISSETAPPHRIMAFLGIPSGSQNKFIGTANSSYFRPEYGLFRDIFVIVTRIWSYSYTSYVTLRCGSHTQNAMFFFISGKLLCHGCSWRSKQAHN